MASFKPKEVIKILERLGFVKKRQTGSHLILYHPTKKRIIPVPIHNKDLKRGLLRAIIGQSESTEDEFLKLK